MGRPPFGTAEFLCRSMESPNEAYLKIYMQAPYQGTETLPGRLRAQQATLVNLPSNPKDNIEAWRRLTTNHVGVTGHLIAEKREAQGEEDPVPGRWDILVSKVLGIRLGDQESYLINGIFRYVHSHFALRSNPSTNIEGLFHPIFYSDFGLAMRPYNVRSLKDGPVSVEELEERGWVF
ncbi:hypothetical protein ATEIFO6365_0002095100 [Aspergillus terreus]|uniref:Uncharacterized protein n=1 Tax=Aspergillus terreus TaxID=33178 RepID=A0A5M3YVC9_ASPTE|nr:hypothetical protein ATETN484_0004077200 [Aspergillus terreus]GFF13840.1 hypothetical protein ATEIFO6365_0002095100 [Aspergillus terreus]